MIFSFFHVLFCFWFINRSTSRSVQDFPLRLPSLPPHYGTRTQRPGGFLSFSFFSNSLLCLLEQDEGRQEEQEEQEQEAKAALNLSFFYTTTIVSVCCFVTLLSPSLSLLFKIVSNSHLRILQRKSFRPLALHRWRCRSKHWVCDLWCLPAILCA